MTIEEIIKAYIRHGWDVVNFKYSDGIYEVFVYMHHWSSPEYNGMAIPFGKGKTPEEAELNLRNDWFIVNNGH